ncbi:MAG: maltokinase [Ilumatobacteraceae bacterium]
MTPGASIELAQRLLGRTCTVERPITVDQTNYSVVVDESVVVKWLRPPVPVPHPGVQLIRHLAAAGFDEMPAMIGVDERDDMVHAIVTSYLSGAQDGWDWYVDDVEKWLAGDDSVDDVIESGRRMGAITARLHSALGDLQPAEVEITSVAERAVADMQLAKSRLDGLDWLDERAVDAALQPLREVGTTKGHRIHGDLHAGQFLRAGPVMVVTDFDGNPLEDVDGRAVAQSPLRDVASMVQSIEHVGAVVVKRRQPDRAADVDRFTEAATCAALDAYGATHDLDAVLLLAFRVAQELHEYAYAIQHLPHWRYVADSALPRLLGM